MIYKNIDNYLYKNIGFESCLEIEWDHKTALNKFTNVLDVIIP